MKRILIHNGSSTNMMFQHTLHEMQILEGQIIKKITILVDFSGEQKMTMEEITHSIYCEGLNIH